MFIDVHCHLDLLKDSKSAVERAKKKGVGVVITNGVNHETNVKSLGLAEEFKVKCALGVYPVDALTMTDEDLNDELDFICSANGNLIAIGEVGMDFKEIKEEKRQREIFQKFIDLALELDKPIIVHSRKAEKECIDILEKSKAKKVVMHCFSGNMNLVKRIIDNGWMMSIPANISFSEHFQNLVKLTPIEHLLCETDSPFLHPEKKENNEPANVVESYKKITEIKGITLKQAEKKIEENYHRLFKK